MLVNPRSIIIGVFLFILLPAATLGQSNRQYRTARNYVRLLHEGTLLVKLHQRTITTQRLRDRKMYKKAEELEATQALENRDIYEAFTTIYTFSDVLFYYADDQHKVDQREFTGIFLDNNFKRDSSIVLKDTINFFIADIGEIFFPAFGEHMEGFLVTYRNEYPPGKPFPSVIRKRSGFAIIERTPFDIVKAFEKKLKSLGY
ncbi:MAG TPA: hypothetical protein DDX92_01560 [Flavobacteriales bacterium]|jgi:hypothetical protein|nr:hypothetical protein [Flavobacteriales bacterium]